MSFINTWKDKIAGYLGEKLDSVKLNFIDKASGIMGYLLFSLVALFIALTIFLFSGMGLSEIFAEAFHSRAGGYFATAGIYALILGGLFLFRKNVRDAFAGIIIRILTQQQEDDDEDKNTEETPN